MACTVKIYHDICQYWHKTVEKASVAVTGFFAKILYQHWQRNYGIAARTVKTFFTVKRFNSKSYFTVVLCTYLYEFILYFSKKT